jgi:hypothetical protein
MNISQNTLASLHTLGRKNFETMVKLPGAEQLLEASGIPAAEVKLLMQGLSDDVWVAAASAQRVAVVSDGSAGSLKAAAAFAGASPSSSGPLQTRMQSSQSAGARDKIIARGEELGLGKQSGMHALQAVALLRLAAGKGSVDDVTQLFQDAARELVSGTHASQDDAGAATLISIQALATGAGLPSPKGHATPASYRDALLDAALAQHPTGGASGAAVGAALFSAVMDTRYISDARWATEVASL